VSTTTTAELAKGKKRIRHRLAPHNFPPRPDPVFAAANIHYDIAARTRGMAAGGLGAIHLMARRIGLIDAIDRDLSLLKVHLPYHESDHVLNIAYNILPAAPVWKTWNCAATTRSISMPWGPAAFRTPPRPATSAAALMNPRSSN
jgi:hypothetical protein